MYLIIQVTHYYISLSGIYFTVGPTTDNIIKMMILLLNMVLATVLHACVPLADQAGHSAHHHNSQVTAAAAA